MWLGCLVAVLLRYLLFAAGVPAFLEEHVELHSPITSFSRLLEGLFLLEGGSVSPYAGGTCHHPPLLLLLLSWLPHAPRWLQFLPVVALDVATAWLLRLSASQYAEARARAGEAWAEASMPPLVAPPPAESKDAVDKGGESAACASAGAPVDPQRNAWGALKDLVSPDFVGLSYLFNPFVVASCLAHSLQSVHHVVFCAALCLAGSGKGGLCAAALALSLYVCPWTPIVMVLPLCYLSFVQSAAGRKLPIESHYKRSKDTPLVDQDFTSYFLRFAFAVLLLSAALHAASWLAMGGRLDYLQASFVAVVAVQELSPNVGIFWYLFVEVFDRYRALFLIVFHGQLLFYPVPLHVRVGRYRPVGPWLHCGASLAIVCIFKPYPTASDFGLMLALLLVQAELIQAAQKSFAFLLSGMLFGLSMFPTMSAVWLSRNAGNANFLYNMTLVVNVFGCLLLNEWLRAGMRLRRRQHLQAFCRDLVLNLADDVVACASKASTASTGKTEGAEGKPRRRK
eukprot:TRINITY_DN27995_c0_g2_i1.p1 TRINITY_DN27995_c0_g2~~TRINITY_DN27995_c0_g2_i1.p1  ORF type:complete len:510 (+),score=95.51 TRINITY_DN27995_c0_g2_i1:106-1635(+)